MSDTINKPAHSKTCDLKMIQPNPIVKMPKV